MEVDSCFENQIHSCPRDLVKPMSLVMDERGSLPHPRSSGLRVSTKSKAPSPPGVKKLDSPGFSQWYPGNPHLTMDQKENLIDKDLSLVVVLPGGEEKMTTVHGSKPVMDLLVTLCAKYHLNPSGHTLELVTANKKNTKLKPNALIGTLEAEKIFLKPKGEDKNKKTGPQMPEATVRMVINYKNNQKTILRVSPRVPLAEHLPAICEKCEFDIDTTVLLRDVQSLAPLDLSSSLNDYAIREVYARDTKVCSARQPASPVCPASPTHTGTVAPGKDKNQKEEENKGLFSKFRKSKKKSEQATTASAPASPVLVSKPRPLSMALPSSNSSDAIPTLTPKKRRAPQPPIAVSQSCSTDASARRRLNSEPDARLDSDPMAGLSRGSSAESSLKRTKRKAPPPPSSPSVAVQQTVPPNEDLQGVVAANALEEIMEQEETTASVKSVTASEIQGEDSSSLDISADVSLHSPSPDTDVVSAAASVEGGGEDQSCDLSSDGNQPQSAMNESAAPSDVQTADDTGSSKPADSDGAPCAVETASQQAVCEEPVNEIQDGDCSAEFPPPPPPPPSPPPPLMQDAEAQASVQENTETICQQTDELQSAMDTSTSGSTGKDAPEQTDVSALPLPPREHVDKVPSSANAESAEKRDMAVSTEELGPPDTNTNALPHASDSTPSAPAVTALPPIHAANSEPKPKPSNELTRDYIPKVGMTTYTIVPQKSLEKLRYFEVALTLETPHAAPEEGLDIGSLQLDESAAAREQTAEVSEEKSELHLTLPREDSMTNTTTATSTSTTTTTTRHTVNGSIPESTLCSSPTLSKATDKISSSASQAGSPAEVKEVKIPPATKPKPGSFRLAQHKKTPGYYVTSAAEKSLSASPASGQREAQASADRAHLPPPPPPPPPSLQCQEEMTGAAKVELSPKGDNKNVGIAQITRQSSLPARELSLEKLRSFAAPRPYSPATPSRFAQAVSSAVKRSQSLSHGPQSPQSPHSPHSPHSPVSVPLSPIASHPSVKESKGSLQLEDGENREVESNKGSTLQGAQGEAPSFSGIVQTGGESSP